MVHLTDSSAPPGSLIDTRHCISAGLRERKPCDVFPRSEYKSKSDLTYWLSVNSDGAVRHLVVDLSSDTNNS